MTMLFEELWNGNLAPYEKCGEGDREVEELNDLIGKNKVSLLKTMDDRQKQLLENFIACYDEYTYLMKVHAFRDGFSLACKLLMEALGES